MYVLRGEAYKRSGAVLGEFSWCVSKKYTHRLPSLIGQSLVPIVGERLATAFEAVNVTSVLWRSRRKGKLRPQDGSTGRPLILLFRHRYRDTVTKPSRFIGRRRLPTPRSRERMACAARNPCIRRAESQIIARGAMKVRLRPLVAAVALASAAVCGPALPAQAGPQAHAPAKPSSAVWKFATSGDSRNCGDIVMPAIAASVRRNGATFYWHLGDFRKMSSPDEDLEHQPAHRGQTLNLPEYQQLAWPDFLDSQIATFGALRVYLAIGNHETVPPKTRTEYVATFSRWIDAADLRAQRLRDDPAALEPHTYYHWVRRGVDFINLDNATRDQFDADQIAWFEKTLHLDSTNPRIRAIVVGMHKPLPESISREHSMNESPEGTESGLRIYTDLLRAQNEDHKRVYVLASHSHIFMGGIFQTEYWREHGGILPGWIAGTAGAQRTLLPKNSANARAAEMNVYGYLLATVRSSGEIRFSFEHVNEPDIPTSVVEEYTPEFVHWCFEENRVVP